MEHDENSNSNTLDKGTYRARARSWAWDTTKNGDMCLAVMFALIGEHEGYQIDGRLYFDDEKPDPKGRTALDRSMEVLHAMGLQGDDLSVIDEGTGGIDAGEVELVVVINDKGYPQTKYINAPRRGRDLRTFAPPGQDTKSSFFARMKARTAALSAKAAASGARPITPPSAQPVTPVARPVASQQPQTQQPPARVQGFGAPQGFGSAEDDIPF